MAAIDLASVIPDLVSVIRPLVSVGTAVLGVHVGIVGFRFLKRAVGYSDAPSDAEWADVCAAADDSPMVSSHEEFEALYGVTPEQREHLLAESAAWQAGAAQAALDVELARDAAADALHDAQYGTDAADRKMAADVIAVRL